MKHKSFSGMVMLGSLVPVSQLSIPLKQSPLLTIVYRIVTKMVIMGSGEW